MASADPQNPARDPLEAYVGRDGTIRIITPQPRDVIFEVPPGAKILKVVPEATSGSRHFAHLCEVNSVNFLHAASREHQLVLCQKIMNDLSGRRCLVRSDDGETWTPIPERDMVLCLARALGSHKTRTPAARELMDLQFLYSTVQRGPDPKEINVKVLKKPMPRKSAAEKTATAKRKKAAPVTVEDTGYARKPVKTARRSTATAIVNPPNKRVVANPAGLAKPPNSIPTGVTMRPSGKWQAQIYFRGASRYIGVFPSYQVASVAYEVCREYCRQYQHDQTRESKEVWNAARNLAMTEVAKLPESFVP